MQSALDDPKAKDSLGPNYEADKWSLLPPYVSLDPASSKQPSNCSPHITASVALLGPTSFCYKWLLCFYPQERMHLIPFSLGILSCNLSNNTAKTSNQDGFVSSYFMTSIPTSNTKVSENRKN